MTRGALIRWRLEMGLLHVMAAYALLGDGAVDKHRLLLLSSMTSGAGD